MNDREIEARLARAMASAAPNKLEDALRAREARRTEENRLVDLSAAREKKRPRRWRSLAAGLAAALVLVIGGGSYAGWSWLRAPDSLVAIDVNPSVQLSVSRSEKVLSCEALNADGAEIIGKMDLRGAKVDVAVNALIGSMVQHGYIDELKNSVLITVENADAAKAQALQDQLMASVGGAIQAQDSGLTPALVGQTITDKDSSLEQLARENNISEGKAVLIQRILDTDPTLTFQTLAGLSVNDLNLLAQSKGADTADMSVTGQASDKAYIGLDRAREIAQAQLPGATVKEIEFDYDDGMVYEGELLLDGWEYEFEIDALTGAVVKWEHERSDDDYLPSAPPAPSPSVTPPLPAAPQPSADPSPSQPVWLTEEEARTLVLGQIPGAEITELKFERDDGRTIYKGEAVLDRMEYEFKLDAATGAFLKWESERMDDEDWQKYQDKHGNGPKDPSPSEYIGKKEAEAAVLERLPGAAVGKIKLDEEDGLPVYEGKAWLDGWEYEFKLDAATGKILEWEPEPIDD